MKKSILFITLLISISFLISGCGPAKFEPYKPPKLDIEKVEEYNPDLSGLKKPEKPNFIYLDENFDKVDDKSKAKYAALSNEELKKILNLSNLYNTQQEVIKDQKELVNIRIRQINALKEIVELKEYQMDQYISLYANARNDYLQERYENKMSNLLNRTVMSIVTIGSITLAILAL